MTRFTLIPQDAAITIAVRGSLVPADSDRIAAVCVSLPGDTRALVIDLTGVGLVGAEVLRRVSLAASRWRYARAAAVTMRFTASRHDASGTPTAEAVPAEVRYPARVVAPRARGVPASGGAGGQRRGVDVFGRVHRPRAGAA